MLELETTVCTTYRVQKQTHRTFLDVSEDLLENVVEGRTRREEATTPRVRAERPECPGVHVVAENRGPSVAPVPGSSSSPGTIAVRLDSLCPKEQHRHRRDMNAGVHHAVAAGIGVGAGVVVGNAGVVAFVVCGGEGRQQSGYPPSKYSYWTGVHQNKTRVEPGALPRVGRQRTNDPCFPPETCFYIFPDTRNAESRYWLAGIPLSPHEARSTKHNTRIADETEHVYRGYCRDTRSPRSHETNVGYEVHPSKAVRWKRELEDREREPGAKAT